MKLGFQIDWEKEPALREKLLFALLPFLLIIPFSKATWSPIEVSIEKNRSELTVVEMQISTIKKMLIMTEKQLQVNDAVVKERSKVNDRVIRILNNQTSDKNKEVADIINKLSSRELAKRLLVHDIAVGAEVVTPTYTAIPISVVVEGGYGALENYLALLEDIEKPFIVRDVILDASKETEGSTINAKLKVLVYLALPGNVNTMMTTVKSVEKK
ncbi:MAG: hypothetical protein COS89_00665 [Deltaproteobacteria bacterium CG07_land_8_20_14_0_80_38_7]|nr:MAG: hypothetical protein COS89_00665 [Deltaproteobacteria bacterium CG07_land_8_20_14_0_80_38_7]